MQKIAVYNNATGIAGKLEFLCRGEQIEIVVEKTKEKLLEDVTRRNVSMVLLDIFLDDQVWGDGLRLVAEIRRTCRMPIVVVSGQTSESTKIAVLSIGADDFVNESDNPLVTMARIKSQLRRYLQLTGGRTQNDDLMYQVDGLVINDAQRKVTVDGREVYLTPTEYEILKLLVMEHGKVLSIPKIYEDIWQMQAVDVDNTVAVHVRHIREKIEDNPRKPKYLKAIWGTGYMVG
ncbi:MAG: response regulator transcription factor [Lachnospiraceae bacterium]|nr:response regulator transcription factor [Lachnospiraceae bacterium]